MCCNGWENTVCFVMSLLAVFTVFFDDVHYVHDVLFFIPIYDEPGFKMIIYSSLNSLRTCCKW